MTRAAFVSWLQTVDDRSLSCELKKWGLPAEEWVNVDLTNTNAA